MRIGLFLLLACGLFTSCNLSSRLSSSVQKTILNDSALRGAHVGISIYEPATGKWWYNYQGDKYFVPASNVKLATCYAAMKYLADSLVAARLSIAADNVVELFPSGDPTFLNKEFPYQPLYEILKNEKTWRWDLTGWQEQQWGSGWSWDDYDDEYMVERSPLPVYRNLFSVTTKGDTLIFFPPVKTVWFNNLEDSLQYEPETKVLRGKNFSLKRSLDKNEFYLRKSLQKFTPSAHPIHMDVLSVEKMLSDTLHAANISTQRRASGVIYKPTTTIIYSQPTDSLLKPMMHRSDNFFAEQSLLMVSNERLEIMNDEKIIDTILKTDFKDLPQKPRWVDGSGLSRYNLFTPQDFVVILGKMKAEFGTARLKEILSTGNEGTLSNYYKSDSTAIYAKTGSLSGVVALSGLLTTLKGKELIFSILVNNHQGSATRIRRAVEKFIQNVRNKY